MSVELAGLISSVTTLNSIARTVIDALKASKLDAEIGKFQKAILEANSFALTVQQQQFSLAARVQELEKENARLKDWSAEKSQYTLREIAVGVFVYLKNDAVGHFASAQKLCSNCFDQETKSLMQQSDGLNPPHGRCIFLTCARCKNKLSFECYKDMPQPGRPSVRWGSDPKIPL